MIIITLLTVTANNKKMLDLEVDTSITLDSFLQLVYGYGDLRADRLGVVCYRLDSIGCKTTLQTNRTLDDLGILNGDYIVVEKGVPTVA